MRTGTALIAVVAAALLLPPGALAAAGSLDPMFSGDGRQTTVFGPGNSRAEAVAIQPDGKIVAVGTAAGARFAVARYSLNGSLDPTFSGDGRHTTDFAGDRAGAYAGAIQADGRIVVVGTAGASGPLPGNFALARYNPNGSLDKSFSGDGKQTTDFGGYDGATGVALQANGKIVAAGGGAGSFAIARYHPNGSLDTSFSNDGKRLTNFKGVDQAHGVALQGDGKVVAAGYTADRARAAANFALARYKPNGSLDPTFSGDGRRTTDFGGFVDVANGVAIQDDGKIVLAGEDGSSFGFGLARYRPNGSLDPSFSGDGKKTTMFASSEAAVANGVALQRDGKIVAAGWASSNSSESFALARYLGG